MSLSDLRQQASKTGNYESLIGDQLSLAQSVPYIGQGWDEYFDKLNDPNRHWSERYRDISWLTPEQLEAGQKYYEDEAERLRGIHKSYADDWWNAVSGSQEFADWSKWYYNDMLDHNISTFNERPYRLVQSPYADGGRYNYTDADPGLHDSWIRQYLNPDRRMDRPHGEDFDITPEMIERWRAGEDIFANMSGPGATEFLLTPGLNQKRFWAEYQDVRDELPIYEDFDPENERVRHIDPSREYKHHNLGYNPENPFSIGPADEFISDMINRYRTTGRAGLGNEDSANESYGHPEYHAMLDKLKNDPRFSYQWQALQRAEEDLSEARERLDFSNIRDRSDAFYESGLHENFDKWNAILEGGANRPINRLISDDAVYYSDSQAPFGDSWKVHEPDYVSSGKSIKDMMAMGLRGGLALQALAGMRDPWGRPVFVDGEFQHHPDLPGTEEMRGPGGIFDFQGRSWSNQPTEWLDPEEVDTTEPELVSDLADREDEVTDATTVEEDVVQESPKKDLINYSSPEERQEHAKLIWNMVAANGAVEAQEGDANDIDGDGWISPRDYIILANPEVDEETVVPEDPEVDEEPQHTSVWSDAVGPPETAYGAFWQDPGNPEGIQAQDLGAFAVDSTTGVPFVFARNVGAGSNRHRPYANPEQGLRWLLGKGDSTSDWHKAVVEGFVDPSTLTREEYDFANDWWNQQIEENPSYAEGYGYLPSFESLADFQLGETQSDPVDYIRQVAFDWDGISDGQDWAPHEDWANDPNRAWYTHHPLTGEPLENYEQKYYSGYYGYGHKTGDGWVTGQGLPEHLNVLDVGADLPGQNRRLHTDASVTEDIIRNYTPGDGGIFDSSGNLNTSSTSTGTVDEDEGLFDSEGNLNTSSNVSGNQSTHSELEQVIDLNKDDPDFIWDRDTDEDGIISPVDRLHDISAAHQNAGGDTGGGSDTGGDGGGDIVDPGDGNEENRFGMKDEDIVAGLGREDTTDLFHPYGSKEYNEKQGKSAFHKAFGLHRNTPTQNYITE